MALKLNRFFATMSFVHKRFYSANAKYLSFKDFGEPDKVISLVESNVNSPGKDEVIVKMIAAPVNPADINTIQGRYPVKPQLPAVAGNEGVGEIIEVGENVTDLSPGDRVVPYRISLGTWRTIGIFNQNDMVKVPKELGIAEAATLTVNPCTAYRMIKDFVDLKANDTLIQNGANSACGQNVIQICKAWGITSVNVVRNRPDIDALKNYLLGLGANYVFTEEEIRTTDIFKSKKVKKPKLAFNCVGGKSALEIMRHLEHSGALVTYGGMSRDPVTIPTSALIFKNIKVYGYWMTQWTEDNATNTKRKEMFAEIIEMMIAKKLNAPAHQFIKFDNYLEALTKTLSMHGFIGKKYILEFNR